MHCHGGAYTLGSANPKDGAAVLTRDVLKKCGPSIERVFSLEYRLSSAPPYPAANPFPAALLDALAGYRYLTQFGFKAENIILLGDSAGANLVR